MYLPVKPFFITTAIDYTNGAPHIGHAYEKVLTDVIARYRRLKGDEVFYLTGVDQHGQKVQQSAEKAGIAPQEYVDQITAKFRALWTKLGVQYDGWAATTDASHKACVQTLLQRLFDEGQLYKAKQSGYYSVRQEQFLTEKERGPDGEFGPEWGEVILVEEENYWFKLAQHKQWLLDLLDQRPELVVPSFRLAELRNAVAKLEGDLCISRPKSRLTWGIELPFDRDYVTYVWFDALVNYISFAPGYDAAVEADLTEFKKWWPAIHVIGKDIMIPAHGVYWPIMLKAIGFADEEIPQLLVHGWWNISGEKMSKSLGNVVDPDALADKYGAAAVRYYLVSDIVTGKDSDFSEERLIQRYNVDLANGFGNLLNRTLNMTQRYRSGVLQPIAVPDEDVVALRSANAADVPNYIARMDDFQIQAALERVSAIVTRANAFVDTTAPFKLAKDPEAAARLDQVLTALAESVRMAASLLLPIVPEKAQAALDQLLLPAIDLANPQFEITSPHTIGSPQPVFPRIETADA
jgi:methionyl-tRNA synthetase